MEPATRVPAIVAADDNPEFRELLQNVLVEEGYQRVLCVTNADFRGLLAREPPGLILITISLTRPEVGWALLDQVRLSPLTADVPVILSSTNIRLLTEKLHHLARLNCHLLEKPFRVAELLSLVERLYGPPLERERTV